MWGCFAGKARKTPPQNRAITAIPGELFPMNPNFLAMDVKWFL